MWMRGHNNNNIQYIFGMGKNIKEHIHHSIAATAAAHLFVCRQFSFAIVDLSPASFPIAVGIDKEADAKMKKGKFNVPLIDTKILTL